MRGKTITESVTLVTETCCSCGLLFAVPRDYQNRKINDRSWFYCPNGHSQQYAGPTDADRERKRAEQLERQLASARDDERAARMARDEERRRHAATKGQLTKTRKRADAGVCQHCHRSFANVARHVAHMHSDGA